jgi:hypothetical protein
LADPNIPHPALKFVEAFHAVRVKGPLGVSCALHVDSTLMHLQGVPAAVIAAWIGHKDASLTMKLYAHSQDDALKAAGATLNRVVTSRDTDAV